MLTNLEDPPAYHKLIELPFPVDVIVSVTLNHLGVHVIVKYDTTLVTRMVVWRARWLLEIVEPSLFHWIASDSW